MRTSVAPAAMQGSDQGQVCARSNGASGRDGERQPERRSARPRAGAAGRPRTRPACGPGAARCRGWCRRGPSENGSARGVRRALVADVDLDRPGPVRRTVTATGPRPWTRAFSNSTSRMWPTAAASSSAGLGRRRDAHVPPGRGVARPPALGVVAHERADVAPRRGALVVAGQGEHALDRRLEAVERPQALGEHLGAVGAWRRRARPRSPRASPPPACAAGATRATRTSARAAAARGCGRRRRSARRRGRRARRCPACAGGGPASSRPIVDAQRRSRSTRSAQAPRQAGRRRRRRRRDRHRRRRPSSSDAAAHADRRSPTRGSLTRTTSAAASPSRCRRGGRDQLVADVPLVRLAVERRCHRLVGDRRTARPRRARPSTSYSAEARDPGRARRRAAVEVDSARSAIRLATIDASRCSSSRSLRRMPLRTASVAGTKKAIDGERRDEQDREQDPSPHAVTPRRRPRSPRRRGGSRHRGWWRCGWARPAAHRACGAGR